MTGFQRILVQVQHPGGRNHHADGRGGPSLDGNVRDVFVRLRRLALEAEGEPGLGETRGLRRHGAKGSGVV